MRTIQLLSLIVLIGAGCRSPGESAPPQEMKASNLLKQVLSRQFIPNREVIVALVEIPPNQTVKTHWHPGEEFHYYLEGEVTIDFGGKRPNIMGKPGQVGHVPYKAMHSAITGEKGAKVLVFRVHEEGKPIRYMKEGGTADR